MMTATESSQAVKEMGIKLNADDARQIAAEILAAKGCELIAYNGRSNFIHVRRTDGRVVLCSTYRHISLRALKDELSDESLYNSKVIREVGEAY